MADFQTLVNPGGRKVEVPNAEADALLANPNSGFKKASGRAYVKPGDEGQGVLKEAAAAPVQDRVAVVNNEEGTQDEDLAEMKRADLNNVASDLGVEFPEKLANKDEVIAAINEKRGSASTEGDDENQDQE